MASRSIFVVIMNQEGKILLVHNKGGPDMADRPFSKPAGWGLPGGGINPAEDEMDAAVREVLEETGYVVEIDPKPMLRDRKMNGHIDIVCRGRPKNAKQLESSPSPATIGAQEIDGYRWVTPNEIIDELVPALYRGQRLRILEFLWLYSKLS